MSTLTQKKRNFLRTLFAALSFTGAAFAFQACYGTLEDYGLDVKIEGIVKSKSTGLPVKGIKVSVANQPQYEFTDEEGKFRFYSERDTIYTVKFEDVDTLKNGLFKSLDSTFTSNDYNFFLNISLDDK